MSVLYVLEIVCIFIALLASQFKQFTLYFSASLRYCCECFFKYELPFISVFPRSLVRRLVVSETFSYQSLMKLEQW